MPRLKLFEHMNERIIGRVAARPWRFFKVEPRYADPAQTICLARQDKVRVAFEVRIGTEIICDDNDEIIAEAHEQAARMLQQEIMREPIEELRKLHWWVFQQGIGRDVEGRIGRIIRLLEGRDELPDADDRT